MNSDDASVVSAQRLLKMATALSDGAAKLHTQLHDLEPAQRDAIVDLVTEQVAEIVALWADMVRGVVSTAGGPGTDTPAGAPQSGPRGAPPGGPQRRDKDAGDHPARLTASTPTPTPTAGRPTDAVRPAPAAAPQPIRALVEASSAPRPAVPETTRDSDRLTRDELTGVLNRQAGFAALGARSTGAVAAGNGSSSATSMSTA